MQQKVWVINDQDWNRRPAKRAIEPAPSPPGKGDGRPAQAAAQKSPAVAFSLGICIWGGGQLYLGRYRAGTALLAAMALFYGALSGLLFWPQALGGLAAASGLPAQILVVAAAVLFLAGLGLWLFSAVEAYYRTARLGDKPFGGVDNELWPLLGSLLCPGWGQFLNGQPKKGLCVQLLALPGLFALFLIFLTWDAWPLLEASPLRPGLETALAAGLVAVPLTLLVWIVAAYEAFRSCRVLFRKRLSREHAAYRPGGQRYLRRLIPRGSAVLGLLLALSLGMQFLPRDYYLESLARMRGELLASHLVILPQLIGRVIDLVEAAR